MMRKSILLVFLFISLVGHVLAGDSVMSGQEATSDFRTKLLPQTSMATESVKGPSVGRAFLYSLVLPGSGQFYAGSSKMGRIFLGSEGLLWATFFSFRAYGHWKEMDYQKYAVAHAGISTAGKDYDYYVAVEDYMNIRAYNEAKLQQRDLDAMYPEDENYSWQWDSENAREAYEHMRVVSDRAYRHSLFVVGGIVINHIISGIDAARLARKGAAADISHVGVYGLREGGFCVSYCRSF